MFGKLFSSEGVTKDFGLLVIRLGIGTNHLRLERRAIVGHNLDLYGLINHMVVGDDVAVGTDEKPGALSLHQLVGPVALR